MPRRPIGQILVEKNEISEQDLEAALAEQERTGRRLGEILIESGRISWLALARAIAEQVLDIQAPPLEPAPPPEPVRRAGPPPPDPVDLVRAMVEHVANTTPRPEPPAPAPPPVTPVAAPAPSASDQSLARLLAEQVANLGTAPTPAPVPVPHAPSPSSLPSSAAVVGSSQHDAEQRLQSVEALLRERQRAFIELVTTTETLRMKVTRLEEIIEERDRELARLRLQHAS
jgi:hypothetical protein